LKLQQRKLKGVLEANQKDLHAALNKYGKLIDKVRLLLANGPIFMADRFVVLLLDDGTERRTSAAPHSVRFSDLESSDWSPLVSDSK
jgi:hypothetical protein